MYKELHKSLSIVMVLLLSMVSNAQALQGDPKAGLRKSATCAACHGADGNSVVAQWPKLAGQHYEYTVEQIKNFRKGPKGPRHDPSMYPMVKDLSNQDIADLSAYFSKQTISKGKVNKQYVELGQKIYRGGIASKGLAACIACHGPAGNGNAPAKYPKLSAQHAEYTISQLQKYRDGTRTSDMNNIMRDIASKMSDEEIEAVSHYIQGLY